MKKKKILSFLVFAVLMTGVILLINHLHEPEGYTIRELGQQAVALADDFLDGDKTAEDVRVALGNMIESIDRHVENRRDPLTIPETNIRLAISRLHLDFTFPNNAQVLASRNSLADLAGVGSRT